MSDPFNKHIDHELLVRFLSGDANGMEIDQVKIWIEADERNRQYVDQMRLLWESSGNVKDFMSINVKEDWEKVSGRINKATSTRCVTQPIQKKGIIYQWMRLAAAITILLSAYFTWPTLKSYWIKDVVSIAATDTHSSFSLPDGSEVYLNKNARLSYTSDFDGDTRTVELEGEAFFKVTKDETRPFMIKLGQAVTEVVGTSFNVNSTGPGQVVVTVVTGKVLLYGQIKDTASVALTAGEQGKFDLQHGLTKVSNEDINFLSWKTGELVFHNTGLPKVVADLNRHYGKVIQLASPALESCTLTSTFREQPLEEILRELQMVLPVQIKKKENMIVLSGEGCKSR
ncbi:DUF4974 domain-containing protein [Fulvivirga sp. M361]|uniref:FecR family protein n=1 Tax=Fulvivirga sp. M361 TaxID=2594266 RepID=UPI001179DD66|nr:FecR domain-containing protein [Fulvivirga sp. M361]TRX60028.1 DUF4974 domain-containing protein [Fulvivirga sp. M361]